MLKTVLLALAFTALPLSAQSAAAVPGRFFHHVFFWLNSPDSSAARQEFVTALKKMKAIPGVRFSSIGTPAGTPRDVVDNTWTFDWLVTFDDKAAWQVYNDHPIHDEFRKKAHLWKRVQIYDTLRQD